MFIELAEMLRCPQPHEESFLVVATDVMQGRSVRSGVVGCPVCNSEYPVHDGVVHFGDPLIPRAPHHVADAETVHALLGLTGPGGYVGLVGTATRAATDLARLLEDVHFIGINPPPDVTEDASLTLLIADGSIPLRTQMARGVVVGGEFAHDPWVAEAVRITLRGQHIVVQREGVDAPNAVTLASGDGMWVGERR